MSHAKPFVLPAPRSLFSKQHSECRVDRVVQPVCRERVIIQFYNTGACAVVFYILHMRKFGSGSSSSPASLNEGVVEGVGPAHLHSKSKVTSVLALESCRQLHRRKTVSQHIIANGAAGTPSSLQGEVFPRFRTCLAGLSQLLAQLLDKCLCSQAAFPLFQVCTSRCFRTFPHGNPSVPS